MRLSLIHIYNWSASFIRGGTFTNDVTCNGTIEGGTFKRGVTGDSRGMLLGGDFTQAAVTFSGGLKATGGAYNGYTINQNTLTVTGAVSYTHLYDGALRSESSKSGPE